MNMTQYIVLLVVAVAGLCASLHHTLIDGAARAAISSSSPSTTPSSNTEEEDAANVEACPMSQLKHVVSNAYTKFHNNLDAQIQQIRADAQHYYRGHWNVIIFPQGFPHGIAWHLDGASHRYCQTVYGGNQYVIWANLC